MHSEDKNKRRISCNSVPEMLALLESEMLKHGKNNIITIEEPRNLLVGFESPDIKWLLRLSKIRKYYEEKINSDKKWKATIYNSIEEFQVAQSEKNNIIKNKYLKDLNEIYKRCTN